MNIAQINAALSTFSALFPLFTQVVASVETLAPKAPGPTKLDAALAMAQTALTTVAADSATIAQAAAIAPAMIALAKAQYNAQLPK